MLLRVSFFLCFIFLASAYATSEDPWVAERSLYMERYFNSKLPRPLPEDPSDQPPPDRRPPQPPQAEVPYSLGSGETNRLGTSDFDFHPRFDLDKVIRIRLILSGNPIDVEEVEVVFADNGERRRFTFLEGELNVRFKEVFAPGRPVYRISIKASSVGFWKKPGGFRLDIVSAR